MPAFRTPVDLANKALSILRQPAIYSFADNTVQAIETNRVYDFLRLAELRRACWRFSTRRVILRAITQTTQYLSAPAWVIGSNYIAGDIVTFENQIWEAVSNNTGQQPGNVPANNVLYWDSYFGPLTIDVWNGEANAGGNPASTAEPTSYFTNELVYMTPGDGTYTIYRSLISSNSNDPATVDAWNTETVYDAGDVVSFNSINYQSITGLNFAFEPDTSPTQWTTTITSPLVSNSWVAMTTATLAPLNIEYPLGAGPASDYRTRNCYRLPSGFLRQCPTDPKADVFPFLGAPTGNNTVDWLWEFDFIVSRNFNPIMLRFVADVQSVTSFDSMFAEGLATRMAIELAPRLADAEHLPTIIATSRENYARTISEARTVNGIETGSISPDEDSYITCRI